VTRFTFVYVYSCLCHGNWLQIFVLMKTKAIITWRSVTQRTPVAWQSNPTVRAQPPSLRILKSKFCKVLICVQNWSSCL
jgi:hypothetical protein